MKNRRVSYVVFPANHEEKVRSIVVYPYPNVRKA